LSAQACAASAVVMGKVPSSKSTGPVKLVLADWRAHFSGKLPSGLPACTPT
jgi:hypothetical protein